MGRRWRRARERREPLAEEKRGVKMAELGGLQTALQAEGHCVIVVEEKGTTRTSSRMEIGAVQVRIKEEATSPLDTNTL
ncbi:UNVERIFIED_CONTAM: hypothetical protein FKN15_051310 [Acipenser sinensis]